MGSTGYLSFSLIFLVSATLCFAGPTEAKFRGINQFCKTSDYKLLCTTMVRGATTLDKATENAILSTLDLAKHWTPKISTLAPGLNGLTPLTRNSILDTCKENFGSVLDNLEGALRNIKAGDKYGVNDKLSAASFTECTDAFKEFGGDVTKLSSIANLMARYVSNCLAVSQQI